MVEAMRSTMAEFLAGSSASGCGLANRPESLSKYWPDTSANSLDVAARVKMSAPMPTSLPDWPYASSNHLRSEE